MDEVPHTYPAGSHLRVFAPAVPSGTLLPSFFTWSTLMHSSSSRSDSSLGNLTGTCGRASLLYFWNTLATLYVKPHHIFLKWSVHVPISLLNYTLLQVTTV